MAALLEAYPTEVVTAMTTSVSSVDGGPSRIHSSGAGNADEWLEGAASRQLAQSSNRRMAKPELMQP
jgi:hypothetical protein